MAPPEIQNVEIPLDLKEFITPDWQVLVDFYPEFCRQVVGNGEVPMDPQPWILMICRALEKRGVRGRKVGQWVARIIEHFGTDWSAQAIQTMTAAKQEAMETGNG